MKNKPPKTVPSKSIFKSRNDKPPAEYQPPKPTPAPTAPPRRPQPAQAPKPDPLAKAAKEAALNTFRAACKHPSMRFERFGQFLRCIDCRRRWIVCLDDFECPDFLYGNPSLSEADTRQDPFTTARTTPVVPKGVVFDRPL